MVDLNNPVVLALLALLAAQVFKTVVQLLINLPLLIIGWPVSILFYIEDYVRGSLGLDKREKPQVLIDLREQSNNMSRVNVAHVVQILVDYLKSRNSKKLPKDIGEPQPGTTIKNAVLGDRTSSVDDDNLVREQPANQNP